MAHSKIPAVALAVSVALVWAAPGRAVEVEVPDLGDVPVAVTTQHVGGDIVELYQKAIATLEKTCDDYRRIRSINLAQIRDMPFEEAYQNVDSVMPIFDPINLELLRSRIRDPADIETHKQEVLKVERDIETMIDLTAKLLLEIEKLQAEMAGEHHAQELKLEDIVQQPEFDPDATVDQGEVRDVKAQNEALTEAAKDDGQRYKDLTELMAQAERQRQEEQKEQKEDQQNVTRNDIQRPRGPDIKDLTQEGKDERKLPQLVFKQHDNLGELGKLRDISKDEHVYGRMIEKGGWPSDWMFVDTWYVIGPFPNPSRLNLDKKFPPETVIDLDATYTGKDGREIRWEFHQEGKPDCIPPQACEYAIFYAYTEVYCDRPMDLWVAIGSDDKGHIWLNDQPIWISGNRLKGWNIAEAFRKVRFRQGVNRILYRVENGWLGVQFSLGVCVQPEQ